MTTRSSSVAEKPRNAMFYAQKGNIVRTYCIKNVHIVLILFDVNCFLSLTWVKFTSNSPSIQTRQLNGSLYVQIVDTEERRAIYPYFWKQVHFRKLSRMSCTKL